MPQTSSQGTQDQDLNISATVTELTVLCKVKGQKVLPFENRAGGLEVLGEDSLGRGGQGRGLHGGQQHLAPGSVLQWRCKY